MKLSVIIPVFNEAANLNTLYQGLTDVLKPDHPDFEVIFVNDGSVDDSGQTLDAIADRDNHIKVIHLLRNYGQTTALMAGFDHAAGDIVVVMDGDNQNDPTDIPRLIAKLNEGYTVVSGWRKNRKDARITRVIPSKIANWLISKVTGIRLHDYGCSLKAYRREVIQDLKLYGEMHRFLPIISTWSGAKVTEIPVKHHPRHFGSSNYGISRVTPVLLDLILIKFFDRQLQHPLHLFGAFGLINLLLAMLTFILMLYYKFWGGKTFIETPLPTLATLFFLMGMLAILLGIVAELVMRIYYESQQKKPYRIKRITS
jgi:glycosyltransferase involved in cell wall biosynthesis